MSSIFTRALGIGFVTLSASALVMSCASSDNGTTHFGNGGSGGQDSGLDSSSGGGGSAGSPSTGGSPGTGGVSNGGSPGTGGGSNGGSPGTGGGSNGGSPGTGGSGTGGTGGGGTCNPAFCPTSGFGTPCCVTPNGPCGVDTGTGCQQGSSGNDF